MTTTELFKSISPEQTAAVNSLLVEQRDAINAMRDEAMADIVKQHADESAKLAEAQAAVTELLTLKSEFVARVQTALQTGDVSEFVAIATDLVTPEEEKAKQADLQRAAELKAQAAEIESKYKNQI